MAELLNMAAPPKWVAEFNMVLGLSPHTELLQSMALPRTVFFGISFSR